MNTPTHVLVAAALLSRRPSPRENISILAGAIAPDLSIFILYVWARLVNGVSERTLWSETYWSEPWQTVSAISNSAPLYAALLAAGVVLKFRLLWLFAAAALLHIALDLPFHASDAHRHFWPFADFRFHSPLSYWDIDHYALFVAPLELAIGAAAIVVLWRRFASGWVRALLILSCVAYAAVPAYFASALS